MENMNKTIFGNNYIKKMKEVGYEDCSDPDGTVRMWFEEFFSDNQNHEEYKKSAEQFGLNFEKYCAALAQLQTNKKLGACNDGPYDVKLFWEFSLEDYESFLKCCPNEFSYLKLISFYLNLNIIRAKEEWQKTGAYSVRIQGMNRQHHISLQEEFDEHDFGDTNYIVGLYDGYPIATCRFYEVEPQIVILGRLVVLPEYRNRHVGVLVVHASEEWIKELGYNEIIIDSRLEVVPFYEKIGFRKTNDKIIKSGNFECIRMNKLL